MAGEIRDYLAETTADYTATQFDVSPQEVMIEDGEFRQKVTEFDDVNVDVLTKSTTPIFLISLRWPTILEADANTIYDFYFDTAKAKGKARTFEFPHPTEDNIYIVRFWSDITRETRYLKSIREIKLRVEGYGPIAPTTLDAEVDSVSGGILLTSSGVTGADSYNFYQSTDGGTTWTLIS